MYATSTLWGVYPKFGMNFGRSAGIRDFTWKSSKERLIAPYKSQVDKVCLFGSRAKGNYRPNSDIDLVLYGIKDEAIIDRLWTLFDESSLPYKVDVKAYDLIDYPPLKVHIGRVCKILFTKDELGGNLHFG